MLLHLLNMIKLMEMSVICQITSYKLQKNYVYLSLLFTSLLNHSLVPDDLLVGTLVPIPKNKRKLLSDSSNYWAIALSSITGKIFDKVLLKCNYSKLAMGATVAEW